MARGGLKDGRYGHRFPKLGPEGMAEAAAVLFGLTAGFVTGCDLLIDGGVISVMRAGKLPTPG